MSYAPFVIEFATDEINSQIKESLENCKYEAVITTLSKSFQLFKVTRIRRITQDGTVRLRGSYHLTSYPMNNIKNTWKDPISLSSNHFLQRIGDTIETYLSNTGSNCI